MQWVPLKGTITTTNAAASISSLLSFEAPTITIGTSLTADPPEDQTVLRIVANLSFVWTSTDPHFWLGLIVTDKTWTPIGTTDPIPDLDKRYLWYQNYLLNQADATSAAGVLASGQMMRRGTAAAGAVNVVTAVGGMARWTSIDIAPKVKIEDGKQLAMVCYSTATTGLTATIEDMRLLMKRSGRR